MEEHDSTRTRIIEAAGEVFAEKGFADGTVREICQRAGANIAAVNYYFGDKLRLYVEAVKLAHAWRVKQAQLPEWAPDVGPEERLAGFIQAFMRRMLIGDETWHSRLMLREMLRPDSACAEVVREYIRPEFDALLSIVRDLMGDRWDEERGHLIAFSIVGQCLHYRVADPVVAKLVASQEYARYTPARLAAHVLDFSLRALGRDPDRAIAYLSSSMSESLHGNHASPAGAKESDRANADAGLASRPERSHSSRQTSERGV